MSKDIMAEATPKKVKNPTMFEVDDKNREHEYVRRRYSSLSDTGGYVKLFKSFIQSLGFEYKETYPGSNTILIQGVSFDIETKNASYKTANAYTRKVDVRKPENRYIRLYAKIRGAQYGIKIHFNKEYSADTLRKKINAGIDASKSADLEHQKYKDTERENTVAVGRHFAEDAAIKMHIKQIAIGQGDITLYSNTGNWFIVLFRTGKFRKAGINSWEVNTVKQMRPYITTLQGDIQNMMFVSECVDKLKALPERLSEWVDKTYHKYYSVKADNASN